MVDHLLKYIIILGLIKQAWVIIPKATVFGHFRVIMVYVLLGGGQNEYATFLINFQLLSKLDKCVIRYRWEQENKRPEHLSQMP